MGAVTGGVSRLEMFLLYIIYINDFIRCYPAKRRDRVSTFEPVADLSGGGDDGWIAALPLGDFRPNNQCRKLRQRSYV